MGNVKNACLEYGLYAGTMTVKEYPKEINDPALDKTCRLAALRSFAANIPKDQFLRTEVNNHIHTIYSFSPYTPSMAALKARDAGLGAAGSVDHDSVAAAEEMISACSVLGIGGCSGFEVRVSFKNGLFAGRKINNPDSSGNAYMTVQGIPAHQIQKAGMFLSPIREQRLKRTKAMAISANAILKEAGFAMIDFDRDIAAKSKYGEGGGITERHLLAAIAEKIINRFGKGVSLAEGLEKKLQIKITPKFAALLSDLDNPHCFYDLLGILKTEILPGIFIQPDLNECIPVEKVTAFAASICAIPAYAYLGDVCESPTGDKKAEKFEDDYIEELFAELARLKFKAVTYMPPRNTKGQLLRVKKLCAEWGFMEISGVDINSSRQSFNCPEVLQDEFRHLLDTTWALIAHEKLASVDRRYGLFSEDNPLISFGLAERLAIYTKLGKKLNLYHPEESAVEMICKLEGNKEGLYE